MYSANKSRERGTQTNSAFFEINHSQKNSSQRSIFLRIIKSICLQNEKEKKKKSESIFLIENI